MKKDISSQISTVHKKIDKARIEMKKVIIGQEKLIDRLLQGLFVRGHILLEGVPGLAKTTAILALSQICKLDFQRIQFTPDLLPSDVLGNRIFDPKSQDFKLKKGPVFTNFLLADEINRAPAKVQSALLEAMQEKKVTIGDENIALSKIFFVLATQNPIEQEGTFPLPEAQVDRFFFKVVLHYPSQNEEMQILDLPDTNNFKSISPVFSEKSLLDIQSLVDEIFIDESVKKYITDIVFASRDPEAFGMKDLKQQIAFGASPRGSMFLARGGKVRALMEGRDYVTPEDIKAIAHDILRHRIVPTFEAEADNITPEKIITDILDHTIVP